MAADLDAVWWDPAETLAAVLWQLRLAGGDIDEEHIRSCIAPAGRAITTYIDPVLDVPGPPPAPALQTVLEAVTIAIYHRDQVGATVGGSVSTPGPTEPFDPLADVTAELDSYREQWGTA